MNKRINSVEKFIGTGVALVTPFDPKGMMDKEGFEKLLKHTADNGVNYWVVQGTTGESPTLTTSEKSEQLQFAITNNHKNLPIVFGIGGNNTAKLIETINNTDFAGVDAILSSSPNYSKPSQAGIIAHFEALADASPVPIILYNVPGRTSSNLAASTTLTLAQHNNIIGIKEASGDVIQCLEILRDKPESFFVTSGDDLLTIPLMSMGAIGAISVLANGLPKIFSSMVNSCIRNDYKQATQCAFKLSTINSLMYEESNPVGIKELLSQIGICGNNVRLPLLPASDTLQNNIAQKLPIFIQ